MRFSGQSDNGRGEGWVWSGTYGLICILRSNGQVIPSERGEPQRGPAIARRLLPVDLAKLSHGSRFWHPPLFINDQRTPFGGRWRH